MHLIQFLLILLSLLSISMTKPQEESVHDKIKEQDIANSVIPEKPEFATEKEIKSTAIPEIHNTHFDRPGAAVVRIIDDIFQIPIGVLQSVSRLLKNTFVSHPKTPETASSY